MREIERYDARSSLRRWKNASSTSRQRETGADPRENQPGDACGDDRNDPVPREFLHEQISKTGPYRLQRLHRSPQFIVECRSARRAAYQHLNVLVLLTRGPMDMIRRPLVVSNSAQSFP